MAESCWGEPGGPVGAIVSVFLAVVGEVRRGERCVVSATCLSSSSPVVEKERERLCRISIDISLDTIGEYKSVVLLTVIQILSSVSSLLLTSILKII